MLTAINPSDNIDWLREIVLSRRTAGKWSRPELAKRCGIPAWKIAAIEKGRGRAAPETLHKILECMAPDESP